ncbi:MAG TPA: DUF58 domain-containing protein [Desulfobulbus sp.]|nr:DUF58 domain-containing protein [Desulfobulbus sp.]
MTPAPRLIQACCLLTASALAIPLLPWLAPLWTVLACLLAGVALADCFLVLRTGPEITLTRTVATTLPVSAPSPVELSVCNRGHRRLAVTVHDLHPAAFSASDLPVVMELEPGRCGRTRYTVVPSRRGRFSFAGGQVAVPSPLALWRRRRFIACRDEVMVFPDFRGIIRFTLLAVSHELGGMGIRRMQRRGEGGEFHQLREYRQGDELRKIDWKATSRYGRLISREYEDERDQHLVFMLDCGRRMRHVEAGGSLLDQALAAVLLLAHVADRQGDAAGIYSFGGDERWIAPRRTGRAVRELLRRTFDLHATSAAADYLAAAARVSALQGRRSLVILVTSSRAEDQEDVLQAALLLARRHLVVVADLRESVLDAEQQRPVTTLAGALRYQALREYLDRRQALGRVFAHHGILSLDVTAAALPAALVNQYLEIKGAGRL